MIRKLESSLRACRNLSSFFAEDLLGAFVSLFKDRSQYADVVVLQLNKEHVIVGCHHTRIHHIVLDKQVDCSQKHVLNLSQMIVSDKKHLFILGPFFLFVAFI